MTHAKRLWSIWQALLSAFAWAFTRPSFRRFAERNSWPTSTANSGVEDDEESTAIPKGRVLAEYSPKITKDYLEISEQGDRPAVQAKPATGS